MKTIVVLNLSKQSNSEILVMGDRYVGCTENNTLFASAEIKAQVTAVKASIVKLRNTLNAPISEDKTDKIRSARDILERDLTKLGSMVEYIANAPAVADTDRIGIVHSAGMEVRDIKKVGPRTFSVTNGATSGTVLLTATGGAKAHEWQYTTDTQNFTDRIAAESTSMGRTEISNLLRGKEYAFFHKAIKANNELGEWEGPILAIVG